MLPSPSRPSSPCSGRGVRRPRCGRSRGLRALVLVRRAWPRHSDAAGRRGPVVRTVPRGRVAAGDVLPARPCRPGPYSAATVETDPPGDFAVHSCTCIVATPSPPNQDSALGSAGIRRPSTPPCPGAARRARQAPRRFGFLLAGCPRDAFSTPLYELCSALFGHDEAHTEDGFHERASPRQRHVPPPSSGCSILRALRLRLHPSPRSSSPSGRRSAGSSSSPAVLPRLESMPRTASATRLLASPACSRRRRPRAVPFGVHRRAASTTSIVGRSPSLGPTMPGCAWRAERSPWSTGSSPRSVRSSYVKQVMRPVENFLTPQRADA